MSPIPGSYRVFWQPGCTSCLRAKEFLTAHGISFESINVLQHPSAMEELAARGIHAVPVIARGTAYVLGQDLDELADFLGVPAAHVRLGIPSLLERLDRLLRVASAATRALPSAAWNMTIPQRERTYLDLGYHIAMISVAFVDAAEGAELEFARYELRTPPECQRGEAVAALIEAARQRLSTWAQQRTLDPQQALRTYFGNRPLHIVLERTAWHVAQHCRQLEHIAVDQLGVVPNDRLRAQDLAGLPLPHSVWDPEIANATPWG
jgi:glutaredoxin